MSLLSRLLRRWGYVKLADYGLQLRDDRVVPLAPGLPPGQAAAPAPQEALPPGPPQPQPGPAPGWPGQGAPWQGAPPEAPWPQASAPPPAAAPPPGAAPWPADGGPPPGPAAAPSPFAAAPSPALAGPPPAHARGPLPPVPSAELTPPETAALDDPRFEDTMSFLTVDGEEPAGRDAADAAVRKVSGASAPSASPAPAPRPAPGAPPTRAARPSRPPAGAMAASVGEVGARLADDSDDATVLESHPAGAHFFAAQTTAARPPAPRQIPTVIAADALASGTPLPGAGTGAAESSAPDDTDVRGRGD